MPVVTLDSPADLQPGDRLPLEGVEDQWTPPLESVDTSGDPVLLHLGDGQPGPFVWAVDTPVTVLRD